MQLWCDLRNYTAFAWRAEDTRKNPQSKFSVSNLRFEPTTSRIQRRSAVHLTATFRVHVVHVLMKKEDGIYVACNTHQRGKNCTQSFGQKKKVKGRDYFQDLYVGGSIILRWVLKKCVKTWAGFYLVWDRNQCQVVLSIVNVQVP